MADRFRAHACLWCGNDLEDGTVRIGLYCSSRCRGRAYENQVGRHLSDWEDAALQAGWAPPAA